jgi:hypothetical protein
MQKFYLWCFDDFFYCIMLDKYDTYKCIDFVIRFLFK